MSSSFAHPNNSRQNHRLDRRPIATLSPFHSSPRWDIRWTLCLLTALVIAIVPQTSAFSPFHLPKPRHFISASRRPIRSLPSKSTPTEESTIDILTNENKLLKSRLRLLQLQNDELVKLQQRHDDERQVERSSGVTVEQRLILEDFEGEGRPSVDAMGRLVDGWDRENKRYTEPWDNDKIINGERPSTIATDEESTMIPAEEDDELGLLSDAMTDSTDYEEADDVVESQQQTLQKTPSINTNTDDAVCEYNEQTNKWTSSSYDECPVEPNISFLDALKSRANWLVGLLVLQSCSGFILARNEALLQDHPVIVYFLTMLVGAGGNAGNQASVRVIRGLALGTLNKQTQSQFLNREFRMACALSTILSVAGFIRATVFHTPFPETLAVTCALSLIVFSSICLGAVLPLFLQRLGVDPAHSSTTIQVIMDILGVVLTVFVSTAVLDSALGKVLVKALGAMGL